jgi:hypothetical protein
MKKIKSEVAWEIDNIIDRTISKNKSLYKMAQREVNEYFMKVDSKKKSPGSSKTCEGTPCFDERNSNYSFYKSGKRTNDKNDHPNRNISEARVTAFEIIESSKSKDDQQMATQDNTL